MNILTIFKQQIRDVVFGLEDSLVSTLGTITGIALSTSNVKLVILSGFILLGSESTSMAMGSFLSSQSVNEIQKIKKEKPLQSAIVMFLFYVLGGLLPIIPYYFFSFKTAIFFSISITLFCLFILGFFTSKPALHHRVKRGFEMMSLSVLALLIGYFFGYLSRLI